MRAAFIPVLHLRLPHHTRTPLRRISQPPKMSALVQPTFLDTHPNATILDATWAPPPSAAPHLHTYHEGHIPHARFFDLDAPAMTAPSALPHMLPTASRFTAAARALRIRTDAPVVVYSRTPFVASARVWWMLRAFGKQDVYVLNGGFDAWLREGRAVEQGAGDAPGEGDFEPVLDQSWVRSMDDMLRVINAGGTILDARSRGRFHATEPEPRPGLRGGHMPGAKSLPARAVVREDGTLRTGNDLRTVLAENGITDPDLAGDVALTCGSGVTAAVLCLALHEIGVKGAVYDGSWSEYGAHPANPVE